MPAGLWTEVSDDLRRRVLNGEWAPGEQLPPQRTLAEEMGVSGHTLGRAIAQLIQEGVLASDPARPAGGTWVAEEWSLMCSSRDHLLNLRHTGRATGTGNGKIARIISARIIPADETLAAALGVEPGAEVVARHRIVDVDGQPVQRSTSYMPARFAELAPGLLSLERIPGGTVGVLEEHGIHVVSGTDASAARGASGEEAAELAVAEGSPVRAERNWWRGPDGEVIEYGESTTVKGYWQTIDWTLGENV